MELIESLGDIEPACGPRGVSLTVGMFDGVHRGHQMLIENVLDRAAKYKVPSMVLTFRNHPLSLLAPAFAPQLLSSPEEKAALLQGLGVDLCAMIPFDHEFAAITAREFIDDVLLRRCRTRTIVCGDDFRFGANGEGDADLLRRNADAGDFELHVCASLSDDGAPIRSSRIRQTLADGHLEPVNKMLGHPFMLSGRVVPGDQRGHKLGFPTANLAVPSWRLIPGQGIYAVRAHVGDRQWGAMLNIGTRPTFGGKTVSIEAYLFDFEGDLYGLDMSLSFVARVRDERRFDSAEALVAQMQHDEKICRAMLSD
ncbi:bifunctional riboflavin kinase/FAD synthetase [bacterium]|nr:bifunctional riboflavin kinase/FAD synthetase [bacterium]